mmetsp:Transcript_49307/g.81855  ORF Transcript_49307/g.81855 Transcript_49307/m.81855 type:complete len:431 (+) Transcript_49307:210-1502(+)|eukprot:CAMPEP_0119313092 /NCGR_PEP_ID=MMETSP1333-20130426/27854_1 /TAXON_ID=418940 /ORGANISM="Scyphosphaera apsteinii, Strain RCC1455" /LENGTH=430 /DNA_ID=CAMNT_0007317833 /DNA_START=246 /DNA_END=1538 /DNA_ORIENTATION=+
MTTTLVMHGKCFCTHWLARIMPVLLCVLSDYIGLSALMPVLPYHLRDHSSLSERAQAQWAGAISSSQFAAVMLACLLMGRVADSLGAKRAVQLAMVGNVVTFMATAATAHPVKLLFIRFGAGLSSPLVPSLAYIFENVTAEHVVQGTSAYMLAVVLGMLIGGAAVGLYDLVGWVGIALLSGSIGVVGLASTLPLRGTKPKERVQAQHVRRALRSPHFVTHAVTAFSIGYSFATCIALLPVMLMERGWRASSVSLVVFSLAIPTGFASLVSPLITRRFGVQRPITCGLMLQLLAAAVLVAPPCGNNSIALILIMVIINFAVFSEQPPNNSRAKTIAQHLTSGGTGTITGWSRFVFSAGCAVGPGASLPLHTQASWVPWLVLACVQLMTLVTYAGFGVSLLSDPDWAAVAATCPAVPRSLHDAAVIERPSPV